MKLEDIKVGMKVKTPSTISDYDDPVAIAIKLAYGKESFMKELKENNKYLTVHSFDELNGRKVVILVEKSGNRIGQYLPEELEPYVEDEKASVDKEGLDPDAPVFISEQDRIRIQQLTNNVYPVDKRFEPASSVNYYVLAKDLKEIKEIIERYGI